MANGQTEQTEATEPTDAYADLGGNTPPTDEDYFAQLQHFDITEPGPNIDPVRVFDDEAELELYSKLKNPNYWHGVRSPAKLQDMNRGVLGHLTRTSAEYRERRKALEDAGADERTVNADLQVLRLSHQYRHWLSVRQMIQGDQRLSTIIDSTE